MTAKTNRYMRAADNAHLSLLADRGHAPAVAEMQRRGLEVGVAATARRNAKRRADLNAYFATASPEARAMRDSFLNA